ncbi:MAG: HAD family phosphatase [Bacteroidota bacterium]
MKIKNIILDLGGVIFDVSYEGAATAFKKLGVQNFDELSSKKKQEHFFDNYEKGIIPDEEFRNEIRKHISKVLTDDEIDAAWNALLFTIPPGRMKFLQTLKNHYRLFLLSNTNPIHIKAFNQILETDFCENILESIFEKMYFSCNLQMRKPDAEIFNFVLEENHLQKVETIFIDDSIQHVEGAIKAGLPAYHLDLSKDTLQTFLPKILSEQL